ncbi:MAG: tetratricopeptide repeat protein [Myxococcales bacterium]|nr:tetratricopeptide repeat protein [Myxococcales bacterium]
MFRRGRYASSLDVYGRAAEAAPSDAEAHVGKGMSYLRLDRLEPAKKAFEEALRVDGAYADAFYGLGEAQRRLGNASEAKRAYRAYLSRAPPRSAPRPRGGTTARRDAVNPLDASASELLLQLAQREISAVEVAVASMARAAETESFGAFLTTVDLHSQAAASDRRRAQGALRSQLDGLVVAVKDNIITQGVRTTCGSRLLEDFVPAYDGAASEALRAAGVLMLGKTNLDEFGMGSSGEFSAFFLTRNPRDPDLVPWGFVERQRRRAGPRSSPARDRKRHRRLGSSASRILRRLWAPADVRSGLSAWPRRSRELARSGGPAGALRARRRAPLRCLARTRSTRRVLERYESPRKTRDLFASGGRDRGG